MKRLLVAVVALAACPHGTRKTLVPDVPTTGDARARSRFLEARSRFEHAANNAAELKQIVDDYPTDPIVPWAELYAGEALVKARTFADADRQLTKAIAANADPSLTLRARLVLGIAKNYEGDPAAALKLLAGTQGAVTDNIHVEYLAALAYATAASERPLDALPRFDELWRYVTPTERAAIVARVEEVVGAARPEALRRSFDELADRKGPSVAVVGSRLALIADQSGDQAGAARLRADVAPIRAAIGLPVAISAATAGPATATDGDAGLVGAVLPLGSSKDNRVAEAAALGLGLAAGSPDGKGVVAIETRAAVDKTAAAQAVDQLAGQNVIAIVGPIEGASVDLAGGRAEALGVPLISLATAPEQRTSGRFVFHLRHSAESRARTLAQRALAKGITKFAVVAPQDGYGKAVAAAFVDAIEHGGGKLVVAVTYPKATKSFAEFAAKATGDWDAVFVPDDAEKLGLLVPALAASGKIPKPVGTKKTRLLGGRPVLLLSTAEELTSGYLTNAGRHSEGALFAPGFYPDDADPTIKPFVDRFVAAYGHAPGATEAYAYDAAQLAAAAGGGGRAQLAATLAGGQLGGITGAIRFDADHRRADPGLVYTVVEETSGWAIRVMR